MRIKDSLKRYLPKNHFAKSVSVLAGGTAAGQAVVILAAPLLTRLYSPEDFGILAVFAGLLGILGIVASLRYQLAIPLAESDEEAAHIVVLSLLVVFGMSVLATLVLSMFDTSIGILLNTPEITNYLWLLPLALLLLGIYQVFTYWAIRTNAFPAIARTKMTQAVCMVSVQLGGYLLGPLALLLGQITGQAAGSFTLWKLAIGDRRGAFSNLSIPNIKCVAMRYRDFPLLSTWTGLSSSAASYLPLLLMASLLGVSSAGLYALAHKVLSAPMSLIGTAVGDVFYREAVTANANKQLGELVSSVHDRLTAIALPSAFVLFFSAPIMFEVIFGASWRISGEIARWIVPWLFFQFVTTPPTRIYPILNRHKSALVFQLSLLGSAVGALVVGGYIYNDLIVTVALLSLFNSLAYLSRLMLTFSLTGRRLFEPVICMARHFPMGVLCGIPLIVPWVALGDESGDGLSWGIGIALSLVMIAMLLFRQLRMSFHHI